jgi:hypothetical protein
MRAKRLVGFVVVVLLGLGLAACGDDDGSDDSGSDSGSSLSSDSGSEADDEDSTTTTEAAEEEDDAGSGESAGGVDAYCDAVEAYIDLLSEAVEDPTSAGTELQEAADAYADAALNVGELTPDEQTQFENCTEAATEALAGGGG